MFRVAFPDASLSVDSYNLRGSSNTVATSPTASTAAIRQHLRPQRYGRSRPGRRTFAQMTGPLPYWPVPSAPPKTSAVRCLEFRGHIVAGIFAGAQPQVAALGIATFHLTRRKRSNAALWSRTTIDGPPGEPANGAPLPRRARPRRDGGVYGISSRSSTSTNVVQRASVFSPTCSASSGVPRRRRQDGLGRLPLLLPPPTARPGRFVLIQRKPIDLIGGGPIVLPPTRGFAAITRSFWSRRRPGGARAYERWMARYRRRREGHRRRAGRIRRCAGMASAGYLRSPGWFPCTLDEGRRASGHQTQCPSFSAMAATR